MLFQVSSVLAVSILSILSVPATALSPALVSRSSSCTFLGLSCPSVDVRAHTSLDCSDKAHWYDFTKRFYINLPLTSQPIAVGKKFYSAGTCQGNYGATVTVTGFGAVAFAIEKVESLPAGLTCYIQTFGDNFCSDTPNWVGPIASSDVGKSCFGPTDPSTGKLRETNSLRLVCCNGLNQNCE